MRQRSETTRHHTTARRAALALAALALLGAAGCGEVPDAHDEDPRADGAAVPGPDSAAVVADDGRVATDRGGSTADMGHERDAGAAPGDAGDAIDAGGGQVDKGSDVADAGLDPDAGKLPTPPAGMPGAISAKGMAVVISKPLAKVKNSSYPASKFAFSALGLTALAVEAYRGNSAVDTKLLAELRGFIDPAYGADCQGGYDIQLQVPQAAMVVIASKVPRIWNKLTAADKSKVALVFKAQAVKAAMPSSDHNVERLAKGKGAIASMRGTTYWPTGNPNFSTSGPAMVQLAAFYLGAAKLQSFLDGFDHAAFKAELNAAGLTNAAMVFNKIPTGAPSAADVEAAVHQWTAFGKSVKEAVPLFKLMAERTFSRPVAAGLNNGAGVSGTPGCGAIVGGAAGLPNKGKLGMAHEFDSVDAEGKRSCADYSYDGIRTILVWAAAGLLTGGLPATHAAVKALFDGKSGRIHIGVTDHRYKTDHGYANYNHGQCKAQFTWSSHGDKLVLEASYSLYFDALRPLVTVP